jgi:hypothetical protein
VSSDAREKSWEDGAPVEYYEFIRGNTFLRYNTSDRNLYSGGNLYVSLRGLSRERIAQGIERNKLTITVRIPRGGDIESWWRPYPSSATVGLTVYGGHIGEGDARVRWIGRVVQPKFSTTTLTLLGEPTTTTAKKSGPQQCWQRGCMHVLYKQGDGLCNANRDTFAVPATLLTVDGAVLTAAEFASLPSGRLAGGYLEFVTLDGSSARCSISTHSGTQISIYYPNIELAPGTVVTAYPGCKHTIQDCNDFFDNAVNYGGDANSPETSPFNGNPVF